MAQDWKDLAYLKKGIEDGNRMVLARALTLVESRKASDQALSYQLLNALNTSDKSSRRIAVSGSPGAGKSTFIEAIGMDLANAGEKVAVLAIDPSSLISGGSILGDKTRMDSLGRHPNAFIRPSPAGETLGGVARSTFASILLCEAAGFSNIIIETVGVGQSEVTARQLCDFFILLLLPGAGDELQGIKKGIMESADLIFINKADGEQQHTAKETMAAYKQALHVYAMRPDGWSVPVITGSALEHKGIEEALRSIMAYYSSTSAFIGSRRQEQIEYWFLHFLDEKINNYFKGREKAGQIIEEKRQVMNEKGITPFEASEQAFQGLIQIIRNEK
jgi:LAO/AO transport system kinase